jgi:hypothetical protein
VFPPYHKLDPLATSKDVVQGFLIEERDVCIKWWLWCNWLLDTYEFNIISKVPVKPKKYNTNIIRKEQAYVTQILQKYPFVHSKLHKLEVFEQNFIANGQC